MPEILSMKPANIEKFIMLNFRQNGMTVFVRDRDGMLVGNAVGGNANYGEDPGDLLHRAFIDNDHAIAFVRERCEASCVSGAVVEFEDREGDNRVIQPNKSGLKI